MMRAPHPHHGLAARRGVPALERVVKVSLTRPGVAVRSPGRIDAIELDVQQIGCFLDGGHELFRWDPGDEDLA